MKIATWNVNSIKARLPNVLAWLDAAKPDVLLMQEIKTVADGFPTMEFESRGYNLAIHGQKTYNGVAIASIFRLDDVRRGLPGYEDPQARFIEAWIDAGDRGCRVASIYLPNGNPLGTEKFVYKLDWMERLIAHARKLLKDEEAVVLGGDYNVIPEDRDCHDPKAWAGDALFQPESRAAFRKLLHLGYTEAFRALHDEPLAYSFWNYQARAFERDAGIRIDHLLLSPQAADRLTACQIDKAPRAEEHASDHVPVWCSLAAPER
ncbi:MAG: exodeoxyribonuclease III [Alphaproteobacteria bacterium]|nr:exodeoxyribonuclease III [Alphaproteobacteria bacterium]